MVSHQLDLTSMKKIQLWQTFDHIHSIFDGNIKGIPVLSVVGLLNDNYEGGDFVMFEDYKVSLKKEMC